MKKPLSLEGTGFAVLSTNTQVRNMISCCCVLDGGALTDAGIDVLEVLTMDIVSESQLPSRRQKVYQMSQKDMEGCPDFKMSAYHDG